MAIPLSATLSMQDNMSAAFRNISSAAQATTQSLGYVKSATDSVRNSMLEASNATDNWTDKVGNYSKAALEAVYSEDELIEMGFKTAQSLDEVASSLDNVESKATSGALDEATGKQERWTHEVNNTNDAYVKLSGLVQKVIGVLSIKQLVGLSDQMTQTTARLRMLGDDTEELGNKIFASAQRSRVGYMDMAENVAKLGMQAKEAFGSTDEIIAFNEGLNKLFTVSGMDSNAISSVMYNLTQSMSTGHLLGNDYRILKMNAPKIVQLLKDTYAGGSQEALDQMVTNGQISSQMMKNAVLGNLKGIDEEFKQMPMTWGQVWTGIVNNVIRLSQPLLNMISAIAQHWSVIEPIVIAVATAVGLYTAALLVNNAVQGISKLKTTLSTIASIAHGTAITAEMTATTGLTSAQLAFNAALYACPLVWIILLIIAIIAIIFVVINLINEVAGTTYSATGIIMGILFTLAAFIFNTIIRPIWNRIAAFVNFFANCFNHPVESIQILFIDLKRTILQVIDSIAKAIDFVFGTNFSSATSSWIADLDAQKEKIKAESGYEEVMSELGEWKYEDAWNSGYSFGEGIEKSIGSAFDTSLEDFTATDGAGGSALKTTTGDDLLSEDDVNVLLRIATRDFKLDYQQITPEIVMNFGDIRETADVDDITNALADKLEEVYVSNLREGV